MRALGNGPGTCALNCLQSLNLQHHSTSWPVCSQPYSPRAPKDPQERLRVLGFRIRGAETMARGYWQVFAPAMCKSWCSGPTLTRPLPPNVSGILITLINSVKTSVRAPRSWLPARRPGSVTRVGLVFKKPCYKHAGATKTGIPLSDPF